MVCFVVIAVQRCLPNSKCGFDCQWTIWIERSSCEVRVDVIHSGDYSSEVRYAAREEKCRVLEDLDVSAWLVVSQ
jgi:hypothetical protein